MIRKVEVVPHDPNWLNLFETESKQIAIALGENFIKVHHIGSTSIETIYAKPIIDILVEVKSITTVDRQNSAMELLNYQCMGEFGIEGRRFFLKDNANGIRTHHVHVFETDSSQVARHLAFRDYLDTHLEDAESYSVLKRSLADKYPNDIERYMDGKHDLIQEIDRKAAEWKMKNQSKLKYLQAQNILRATTMIQSQGEIATNGWVRADWDTYIDAIESHSDRKYNGYYYEGRMSIEDTQKSADHGRFHAITSFAINLFCMAREIPINGLINCSYRKPGIMECQPDLSYYSQDLAQLAPEGVSVVNLDEQSIPNLVIEVSEITLADDLGAKRRLYEEMGVAEYWIVVAHYWILDVPTVKIHAFNMADRSSQPLDISLAIPNLSISTITQALNLSREQDQTHIGQWLMRKFKNQPNRN